MTVVSNDYFDWSSQTNHSDTFYRISCLYVYVKYCLFCTGPVCTFEKV